MAMIYCPECGKNISDKAYVCPNCGMPLKENNPYTPVKRKIPGRGFGIAGMVMGILGVVYSPILIFSILRVSTLLSGVKNDFIGAFIEIAVFGILALVFGALSRRRGYRRGKSLSAVIMGIITLALCGVAFVLMLL